MIWKKKKQYVEKKRLDRLRLTVSQQKSARPSWTEWRRNVKPKRPNWPSRNALPKKNVRPRRQNRRKNVLLRKLYKLKLTESLKKSARPS